MAGGIDGYVEEANAEIRFTAPNPTARFSLEQNMLGFLAQNNETASFVGVNRPGGALSSVVYVKIAEGRTVYDLQMALHAALGAALPKDTEIKLRQAA